MISAEDRNTIHNALMTSNDFVDSSAFNAAKQHASENLEEHWIQYLKDDLKIFLEYVTTHLTYDVLALRHFFYLNGNFVYTLYKYVQFLNYFF